MPLADWVRKLFQSEGRRTRSAARRPEEFVQLRVRRMEERRVFAVTAVTAGTANPVAEGSTFSLTGASYQDSAASAPFNGAHTITVNWGDGSGPQSLSVLEPTAANTPTAITGSHVYANNGNYDVTITVRGADNSQITSAIMTVTVSNVAPTPNANGPYVTGAGGTVLLSGTATDPGTSDTLTYTWDLDGDGNFGETGGAATRGDETGQTPTFNGSAMVRGTQQTISLRVSDGAATSTVTTTVTRNDLPTISAISDIATPKGTAPSAINFTIGDAQTAAGSLTLSASSSNTAVVTNVAGSFTFGGSGANRTLTLTPVADAVGTTTITITVTDGNGESSQETFEVRFNAPPTVTPTVADLAYTEGVGPVALDGGVTLADADGSTLTGATITVTVFDGVAEQLGFTTQNGISGIYAAGTLTLSGSATLAQYQAAIRSITYENASLNPTTTDRTIGISVTDGLNVSNIGTRTLKLTAQNNAPTLAGADNLTAIDEDQTNATNPGTLVSALISGQITDPDGTGQGIAVTAVDNTNGTWQYTINGGANWLAFGTPAAATARLLAADGLTRVRFIPNSNFNGTVAGGLTFQAWDRTSGANGGTADATTGGGTTAFSTASFASDITVDPVNDAPTVTTTGGATTYTEGASGVVIDAGVSVADIDDVNIESATVTITNYAGAEDQLVYVDGTVAGITGGYLNGVLTLTGTATKADYDTALQSVKYHNGSNTPTAGNRTIAFSVNDGDDDTLTPATKTVTVAAVNSAPSLSGGNNPAAVDEDVTNLANTGTLVSALIAGHFTDSDGPLEGIAVTLASNANGTFQYTTDGTNWLSLTGVSASAARLLLADGVTRIRFVPTANFNGIFGGLQLRAWDAFTGANGGTADVTTNGGSTPFGAQLVTLSMTVDSVNDAPTLSGTANLPTIAENISAASNTGTLVSTLISGRTTDVEGAAVGIAVIGVDNSHGAWQYSVDGGTNWIDFGAPSPTAALLLTADAQTRVRFQPVAKYNGTVTGGLTFRAWDQTTGVAGGTADASTNGNPTAFSSTSASANIVVTGVNDKPVLDPTSLNVEFQKGGPPILIDPTITIDDPDSATMTGAVITLTNRKTNDSLALASGYTAPAGITVTPSSTAGTLTITLSGTATTAQYQDVLRHVVFGNSNGVNPNGAVRQITFKVNDGALDSDVITYLIDVDRRPALVVPSNSSFTEGGADLAIATGTVTITDDDDANMTGAVITLSLPPTATGEDQLLFTTQNGITGAVTNDGTNLILTLSGSATKADYVTAIKSIRYRNTSEAPQAGVRTLTFTVTDGILDSNTVSRTLTITTVNDQPERSAGNPPAISVLEDSANTTAVSLGLTLLDYNAGGGGAENQTLTYTLTVIPPAITVWNGATQVTANTVLTLTELRGLTYRTVADANGTGNLTWTVRDNGGTANGGVDLLTETLSITVTAVNDPPQRTAGNPPAISVDEDSSNGAGVSLGLGTLNYNAGGGGNESQTLTYTITAIPSFVTVWNGATQVFANDTLSLAALRGLTYRTVANAVGTADLTWTVTDNGGTSNGGVNLLTETLSITVAAVNDQPVATGTVPTAINVNEDSANATAVTLGLTGVNYAPGGGADESTQSLTYRVTGIPSFITVWNGATQVFANDTLSLTDLRGLTYRTVANAAGTANLSWTVQDNGGTSNGGVDLLTQTLGVAVGAVNDPPVFGATMPPASVTIAQNGTSPTYDITFSDIDNPFNELSITAVSSVTSIVAPGGIALVDNGNGTATLTLTAVPGASGDTVITIRVQDSAGGFVERTIAVKVNNPPAFVTLPVGTTVAEDSGDVLTSLTVSDTETAPDDLVVTAVSDNQAVIRNADIWVEVKANGERVIHAPLVANYSGTVNITVTVRDAGNSTATTQYTIVVTPVNDQPTVPAGQTIATDEDMAVGITLLADDGDPDFTQTLTFSILAGPTRGTLVQQPDGSYIYTPFANYSGSDTFLFLVTDDNTAGGGALTSSLAVFTITVNPLADAPTIPTGFVIRGNENTLFTPGLSILPSDLDGSEAITSIRIENVHPDIHLRLTDGTPILPTLVAPITGRKTYDLTYGQFMTMAIYAPDNFAPGIDITFKVTATSTELSAPAGPGRTATTVKDVGVDIVNVAPNFASLLGTNVDSNASTSLSAVVDDAPRDTMRIVIQWGRSTTGFPQTTTLTGVPPGSSLFQQFIFLVAPNPADPSAPIEIVVTATDKDGGVTTRSVTIQVPGTGIPTPIVRDLGFIDPPSLLRAYSVPETPDVRTTIPTAPTGINDRRAVTQQVKTAERMVELRKVKTNGVDAPTPYRLPLTVLNDLPDFLKDLPDGHYRLYLRENDFMMPRMLADVVVFRGRAVAPGDLQADRPPREFRTAPTSPTTTPDIPPVAKTPGSNETTSDRSEGAGPRLRGPGVRDAGLPIGETGASSAGESNGPGLRRPNLPPPDLNELRGPVP